MTAVDNFSTFTAGLDAPSGSFFVVTPHDTNLLEFTTRALYVGNAGDVRVSPADGGADVTFFGVDGVLPIRVRRVLAAGTTATAIVGLV